jgi:hypothetical protein
MPLSAVVCNRSSELNAGTDTCFGSQHLTCPDIIRAQQANRAGGISQRIDFSLRLAVCALLRLQDKWNSMSRC